MIKADIIADSLNPQGCRLTTFVLEYQRFVHSEFLTHRMLSKNAASSRAIPIEKMIQNVIDNPAMPVWWGANQGGMQAKDELDNTIKKHGGDTWNHRPLFGAQRTDLEEAQYIWLESRDKAIIQVKKLLALGLHKQIANRILEPWFNIRIICSGTEWENFFALRAHPDAQPEIQALAYKMLEKYNKSEPKKLKEGEWHIPFENGLNADTLEEVFMEVYGMEARFGQGHEIETKLLELKKKIAIARCARISYLNYEGKNDYSADIKLCDRLFGNNPKHLSPTEHVAMATNDDKFIGNFKGFQQYRYFFVDQNLKDDRVIKK